MNENNSDDKATTSGYNNSDDKATSLSLKSLAAGLFSHSSNFLSKSLGLSSCSSFST